jgi:hypothetical protein
VSLPEDDNSNEIIAATRAAKRHQDAAAGTPEPARNRVWPIAVAGVAIGSAAVAAALLYAKQRKK